MTTATVGPDTLADVLRHLGDIPLRRILWHPRPGTKLVWVIDPIDRTVELYADPGHPDLMALLRAADTLDGGPVLPGFRFPLAELFNDPQLNPRP